MQVRFGEFTLDTESRLLLQNDAVRHVSPKAFELLHLLLEHRPRALSKAELHGRLWPSSFVSDATLSSLVAEVRTALGETAGRACFVRTVHRFGYAFNATATDPTTSMQPSDRRPQCGVIWEWGQVRLEDGEHLLGRDVDVAVWLESPTVSRHHARLNVSGPDVTIEDLGSKNGTYLRGKRVMKPSPVTDGDEVGLGSILVTIRVFDSLGSTETRHSRQRERRRR
jgi:DNA-binding winged helix-turn-helix (wHTH) protein